MKITETKQSSATSISGLPPYTSMYLTMSFSIVCRASNQYRNTESLLINQTPNRTLTTVAASM